MVHGKPGVGKTTHALRFAKLANVPLVTLESIMDQLLQQSEEFEQTEGDGANDGNESPVENLLVSELRQQLAKGRELTPLQVYRLVEQRLLQQDDLLASGRNIKISFNRIITWSSL